MPPRGVPAPDARVIVVQTAARAFLRPREEEATCASAKKATRLECACWSDIMVSRTLMLPARVQPPPAAQPLLSP